MARPSKYSEELGKRAVRTVIEVRPDYSSPWAAICAVTSKFGIGTPETLRTWIRRAEVDTGKRPGVTSEQAAAVVRSKPGERRAAAANEMVVSADLEGSNDFLWGELDRPGKR